jgi:hypothetical protein
MHHPLQHGHVVRRELAHTLVQGLGDLGVWLALAVDDLFDVVFAFAKVQTELAEVADQELLVGEQLLVLHKITNAVLDAILAVLTRPLRQDCQGVEVLLPIEEHVQPGPLVVVKGKLVG